MGAMQTSIDTIKKEGCSITTKIAISDASKTLLKEGFGKSITSNIQYTRQVTHQYITSG